MLKLERGGNREEADPYGGRVLIWDTDQLFLIVNMQLTYCLESPSSPQTMWKVKSQNSLEHLLHFRDFNKIMCKGCVEENLKLCV